MNGSNTNNNNNNDNNITNTSNNLNKDILNLTFSDSEDESESDMGGFIIINSDDNAYGSDESSFNPMENCDLSQIIETNCNNLSLERNDLKLERSEQDQLTLDFLFDANESSSEEASTFKEDAKTKTEN